MWWACSASAPVRVDDLPSYAPFRRGSVAVANGAVKKMLSARTARYTHRQTQLNGVPVHPDQPTLMFGVFAPELLAWVA